MRLLSAGLFVGAILLSATAAGAQDIDWEKVDAALGRKGAVSADVHRYGFPRSDLTVKLVKLARGLRAALEKMAIAKD
jgi:hypothetical protein